jgi:hypothetical protein
VRALPARARVLIGACVTGGAVGAVLRIPHIARWSAGDAAWAALSLGTVVTERFVATLRHGTENEDFILTDVRLPRDSSRPLGCPLPQWV